MFCRTDCKSVFKLLSISTEMHLSADLALMSTHPFNLTFIIPYLLIHIHAAAAFLRLHFISSHRAIAFGFAKSFVHVFLSASLHYKKLMVL